MDPDWSFERYMDPIEKEGIFQPAMLVCWRVYVGLSWLRTHFDPGVALGTSFQDGPGRDPHRKHRKHVQAQKLGDLRGLETDMV